MQSACDIEVHMRSLRVYELHDLLLRLHYILRGVVSQQEPHTRISSIDNFRHEDAYYRSSWNENSPVIRSAEFSGLKLTFTRSIASFGWHSARAAARTVESRPPLNIKIADGGSLDSSCAIVGMFNKRLFTA